MEYNKKALDEAALENRPARQSVDISIRHRETPEQEKKRC